MRPTPAQPARRRAFVFLFVLGLLVVAIIVIGGGLNRTQLSNRAAEMRLDAYRRHHEMLSVRDIVFTFLRGKETEEITEIAASGQAAQRIELEGGVILLMTVRDGQGCFLLTNVDEIQNEADRAWLIEALQYLPRDRYHDYTRRAGPLRLSLRGSPDEVLFAAALGDERVTQALITARGEDLESQAQLIRELQRSGVRAQKALDTATHFDFEPTIWRLEIEAFHPELDKGFRYNVTAELGDIPRIYDWRLVN